VLNTQLQGTLKKKESEFQKLQQQLLKLLKDTARGKPGTMIITQKLNTTMTKPTKPETTPSSSAVYLLRKENIGLKNIISHYEQQEKHFIDKIVTLQDEVKDLSVLSSSMSRFTLTATPHQKEYRDKGARTIESSKTQSVAQTVVPVHHHFRIPTTSINTPATTNLLTPAHRLFDLQDTPMSSGVLNLSFSDHATVSATQSTLSPIPIACDSDYRRDSRDPTEEQHLVDKMQRAASQPTDLNLSLQHELNEMQTAPASHSTEEEEDLESVWQQMKMLPPCSPATVQLLQSYGWSVLPPVKSDLFTSPAPRHPSDTPCQRLTSATRRHYRDCFEAVEGINNTDDNDSNKKDEEEMEDTNHLYAHFSS